jgi:hypothetical protein
LKNNSYKGNAYGMANTANLFKTQIKSKSENLYFTGQLTVPGPGSSCINIREISVRFDKKQFLNNNYEAIIRRRIFKCSKIVTKTIVLRSRWQYICFARLGMQFIASMVCTFCRWNCGFISWLRQRGFN